jgi:hypothetical protein
MGATEFGHYDGGMVGCVARRPINPGAFEGRGEGWAGELHRDLDLERQTIDRRGAVLSMHDSLTTPPPNRPTYVLGLGSLLGLLEINDELGQ